MGREQNFIKIKKRLRAKMLDEFGYLHCEQCGVNQSRRFTFHHLVYRSEAPDHEELHNLMNLIHVCEACHNDFHAHKPHRKYLIKERKLWELFPEYLNQTNYE